MDLHQIRANYKKGKLSKEDVDFDPIAQFKIWFEDAMNAKAIEPTAMHLATASPDGIPSGRIVLLKDYNKKGFKFYTNYNSRKGIELKKNTHAALTFFWPELERQIRIEGIVEKGTGQDADKYFNMRPEKSRISAIISPQSKEVPDRNYLEEKFTSFDKSNITRPDFWGGYLLIPHKIEFWQGREDRLHDRILYEKTKLGWKIRRLAP